MKKALGVAGWPRTGKTTLSIKLRNDLKYANRYDLDGALFKCFDIARQPRALLFKEAEKVSWMMKRIDAWNLLEMMFDQFMEQNIYSNIIIDGYNLMFANFASFYQNLLKRHGFEMSMHFTSGGPVGQYPDVPVVSDPREALGEVNLPDGMYQGYFGAESAHTDSNKKLGLLRLPDMKGKTFLDVGCSSGFFCFEAMKKRAQMAVGVDVIEKSLREAHMVKDALFLPGVPAFFVKSNFTDFNPVHQFDVVGTFSCLHYFEDFEATLDKVANMCRELYVYEGPLLPGDGDSVTIDGGQWIPKRDRFMRKVRERFSSVEEICESPKPRYPARWNAEQIAIFKSAKRVVIHCRK